MRHNRVHIYGRHAVLEALLHKPQVLSKVIIVQNRRDSELTHALQQANVPVRYIASRQKVRDMSGSEANQGVVGVLLANKLLQDYEDFIRDLRITPGTSLALLSEIKDPHNVGAIIRSAAAFNVAGVLMPRHHQAPITGAVVKVSAGMAFRIPLVELGNVNTAIRDLQERGFHIYGLTAQAKQSLPEEQFTDPAVFILGSEEAGIRTQATRLCDTLLSIPINPRCESLNVAASAAVTFFAWNSQQKIRSNSTS